MSSTGVQGMFDRALRHESPGYALGAQLAELFPDRHLIEGVGKLDLRSFAHAGKCKVAFRDDIYNQRDAYWSEEHGVYRIPEVVWQLVKWEGAAFDALTLRWQGAMHDAERHYVLAPDRERGEAFYAAVKRWNHELRDEVLVFADGCFSKDEKLFEAIKRARAQAPSRVRIELERVVHDPESPWLRVVGARRHDRSRHGVGQDHLRIVV
ncbi:MAG TPA: hypothetical protein VF403_24410, partial [Kofleriaceae bacterium]